jgi:hypothetical protein
MRHEVEDVFLEVGAGAADGVDLALPDHLGQRDAELRRAHRAGERQEHHAALIEMAGPGFGRVPHGGGVEVAVVAVDEL